MSIYITKMFDRLDRICYDRYGSNNNQITEWAIDQNPGLELHGILLPLGITINLPDPPRTITAAPVLKLFFLWK
jgi:phage tail protein X